MSIGEKIRAAVEAVGLGHVASSHHVLTVSIGVATMQGEAFTSSRALVDAADQALYAAKDAGRNRVSSYGPGVPAAEGSAITVVGR